MENKKFEPGDVISFCDEQYFVVENNGTTGVVCPFGETFYINGFYWVYAGERCKFVRKPTPQELESLGITKPGI